MVFLFLILMKKLAIIGIGPRGLYALENLLIELEKANKNIEILLFELSDNPGAGHVWHINQSDSNWMNITERALIGIVGRPKIKYDNIFIEAFPSYHEWSQFSQAATNPDTFPARKKLGKYLHERFNSLHKALNTSKSNQLIASKVLRLDIESSHIKILTASNTYICDDVLLSIGHQSTELDDQLESWTSHTKNSPKRELYTDPYPLQQFKHLKNNFISYIGIRGYGLAMIDVMRYLTINNYGNFKVIDSSTFETVYYKTKEQHLKLIPFSLDGLPMVPKPLNESIDNWYKPSSKEIEQFKSEVEKVSRKNNDVNSIAFLMKPFAKITARIFLDLKDKAIQHELNAEQLESVVLNWSKDEEFSHSLFQDETLAPYHLIQHYVNMALGKSPITLDYCIGQVWRHCQPTLYKAFSHAKVNNEIIETVIALDEFSKRFSYGPPIESMQQVLALVDADILNLDFIKDPNIEMVDEGWKFENSQGKSETCSVIINSVLDAPKLLDVNTSLIKDLLNNDLIKPIHSKLGIETSKDGYVNSELEGSHPNIAVLGRLAKGSVIGVDAILECFGPRIEDWAKSYVHNISKE
ncbi:FAD-NAD(P)-binding protein [Winogradskyella epiphytica]|uniref:FAD-NAD(P)-binding protein n=2 Tax=Winogradskyella epiphytica TaxID=262005 RepID=A0A2V4XIW9_9FLAO|nr:FAD-NAD(P)-binding protein [Winogradskyella epiphytica]